MELIKISELKLKVMLSEEDMRCYDLDFNRFEHDCSATKAAFRKILAYAKNETGFDVKDNKLFVQIYPAGCGGCEMFVTRLPEQSEESVHLVNAVYSFRSLDELLTLTARAVTVHGTQDPSADEPLTSDNAAGRVGALSPDDAAEPDGALTPGDAAERVEPLAEVIDGLCEELREHHIQRLQAGVCRADAAAVYDSMLIDARRISAHCSNIAVSVIPVSARHARGGRAVPPPRGRVRRALGTVNGVQKRLAKRRGI